MANFRARDISFVTSVVNYVLERHNIVSTANHFNVAKDVIVEALDMVRIKGKPYYNEDLGNQIEIILRELTIEARKDAGSKSHRPEVLSEEEVIAAIYYIIFHSYTTRMLGEKYGCSNVTISNSIKKLQCPEISSIVGQVRRLYSKNKANPLYSQMIFDWLFSPQKLCEFKEEQTFSILQILYNQAVDEFGFQKESHEELWTR
ncbi:MAG: hypothetical protein K2J20_06470 [Bacilli bacterium]|nr:hypothetical protein [Bacilli bacterium]